MDQLSSIIGNFHLKMSLLTAKEWSARSAPGKWSKKEILGHLIDSAMNNLRRFIVTQYLEDQKIVYEQDTWVKVQDYQSEAPEILMELWRLLNIQIVRTVRSMDKETLEKTCDTGIEQKEPHTLRFLFEDYIVHMQHHLHHIFAPE